MGKKIIIANWKMNFTIHEASLFIHKLAGLVEKHNDVEIVLAPNNITLQSVSLQADHHKFKLASQNFYWRDNGAFTGEVSAMQLRGLVQYGIVGHSERRYIFHEQDRDIRNKVQAAIRNQITPVLCVGETALERSLDETKAVLHDQLVNGLSNVTSDEVRSMIIAYEPAWAVGTGKDAGTHEVEVAVRTIRDQIKHLFGAETAKAVKVLYGGSISVDNAGSYLMTRGVDGLLIGGASLDAHAFATIVNKAHQPAQKGTKR